MPAFHAPTHRHPLRAAPLLLAVLLLPACAATPTSPEGRSADDRGWTAADLPGVTTASPGTVAYDRDPRVGGADRQTHALFASPCTDPILPTITVPVTIMHGTHDRLVLPRNSARMGKLMPHARVTFFDGMGHDFPPALLPAWAKHVVDNAKLAR